MIENQKHISYGNDACTNHVCDKSHKCMWYIGATDAYKVVNVFVNNESKCEIYKERSK